MKSLFDTKGHDSELNCRSGQTVEVIRQLGADEVDIPDVGLMYRIRFDDGFCADAFIDELPDVVTKRLCEAVFDITTCVLYALTTGESSIGEDSRSVFDRIWEWAKEFEETHPAPEDYMSEVEEFAYGKLLECRVEGAGEWFCNRIDLNKVVGKAIENGIKLYASIEDGSVRVNAEKGCMGISRLVDHGGLQLMRLGQGGYFDWMADSIVREFAKHENDGEEES